MLLRNDLLHYTEPSPRTVRILWIAPEQSHAYAFDVATQSVDVELIQLPAVYADIQAGRASVLPADPYLMVVSQELLPAKHLQLRARAWEIIETLVAQEPQIYEPRLRGQLVAQATARHQVSHPTIYRYLRRYWQRGQTPNALLPDYGNSGARGKVRQSSEGVKRGRPRKNAAEAGAGLNADEDIRRVFRVATARYAAASPRFSRLGAYQQMLVEFFAGRRVDAGSGRVLAAPVPGLGPVPTFGQFNYWLDHDDDRPPEVGRRAPAVLPPVVQAAVPALSAAALPPGRPGAGFYLDAVRAEVQLVSRADRNQAIGRPLVYLVTDSFSRMVCGVYVGLGEVEWSQGILALANCSADKQRFSAQFGRSIDHVQWPCRHLPEALFVNAGLTLGWNGDALLNNFHLRCMAVDSGPDDWRAVLEKRFRLLAPAQAGMPSRLDGVLDLDQFTRIVLDCVLYYNSRQQCAQAGNVTPLQLWEWGREHRSGGLKIYPEQLIRCSLMPVAQASVTPAGIALFDSLYSCPRAIEERWFERARARGGWPVRVAYDPSNLDTVYFLDPGAPLQYHACHLADASAAHQHLSAAEIAHLPRTQMALGAGALRSTTQSLRSLVG